jgi:hypothetical protein
MVLFRCGKQNQNQNDFCRRKKNSKNQGLTEDESMANHSQHQTEIGSDFQNQNQNI